MTKHAQATARIRYLCDSALRSEIVIPLLMEQLSLVVRCGNWAFTWLDADGMFADSAFRSIRAESLRYLAEQWDNIPRDLGYAPHDMTTFPVVSNPRRDGRINPRMAETESYEKIWAPEGLWFNIVVVVRDAGDLPAALIQIYRPHDDVDFDDTDEAALRSVLPYLRRLLSHRTTLTTPGPMAQDGPAGVALFVDDEQPEFVSDRALALSILAFNERMPVTPAGLQVIDPLQGLREMYRQVRDAPPMRDVGGHEAWQPTVRKLANERGSFSFDWEPSLRETHRLWSVVIRHRIPARLQLLSLPGGIQLSHRQLDVCRGLLDGESLMAIAQRIGVKPPTLKDYTREIYRKLDVKDRDSLLRKFIEMPHS